MSQQQNAFDRPLTSMQRQVVRLCALGCTVKQIAKILDLSPCTIDNHKAGAMAKANVTNLARLTRFAIQAGISPLGDDLTENERAKLEVGQTSPKELAANPASTVMGQVDAFRAPASSGR